MRTIECEVNADILFHQIFLQLFAEDFNVQLKLCDIYNVIAVICCDKLKLQFFIQTLLHDFNNEGN